MKFTRKILIITTNLLITSLFLFISLNYSKTQGLNNYFDIFKVLLMLNLIFLLEQYRQRKIMLGCFFVLIAWVSNFMLSLQLIKNEIYIANAYDLFSMLGVVLLIYGIWQATKDNDILVSRLQKIAFYDRLTKLPNRNLIMDSCPVNEEGKRCKRKSTCVCSHRIKLFNSQVKSTIFFIDIDDFSHVNNNLGHFYGDRLLEQIAKRLTAIVTKDEVVIRLAGDEFVIISHHMFLMGDIEVMAQKILNEMSTTFDIMGKEVNVSCSVGIASFPDHGKNIEKVIQKADMAMTNAKKDGKNQYIIYNDVLEKENNDRYDVTNDLKMSIKNNDFVVYYQPKANLVTGEITGLEALVRWNHPNKGLVFPNDFIPLAEATGLIKELDLLVVNLVCQQIVQWKKAGSTVYNVSINISPVLFSDRMFVKKLDNILEKYGVKPSEISIEITENIGFEDVDQTKRRIIELRRRKIKVHLDDFGKGYSSLTYIKQYPIDYLKIDKSFIDDIINNKIDQALVSTIIEVSRLLGIKVISEGVETQEQLEFLKKIGCNEYQGYYLSKPMPIEKLNLEAHQ